MGDQALIAEFGDRIDPALSAHIAVLAQRLRESQPIGVLDIVPAYCTLTLHYDPVAQALRQHGDERAEGGVDAITEFGDQRLVAHRKETRSGQHRKGWLGRGQRRAAPATWIPRAASMRGMVARLNISSYIVSGFMSKIVLGSK